VVACGWLGAETLRERRVHPAINDWLVELLAGNSSSCAVYLGNKWIA